jgi:hypothetical protein
LEDNLHFRFGIAALLIACAGSIVVAQKATTPEELDKAMKKVQPAMQAANKAVNSKAFPEAAKQLAIIKQVMADTREFWVTHKKDDALKANAATVGKIEEAEKLLTAPRRTPARQRPPSNRSVAPAARAMKRIA